MTVTYSPTVAETFTGTITISDINHSVQKAIPFSVDSTGGQKLSATPNQLIFGSTLAGTISAPQSVTVIALTGNPIQATMNGAFQITQGATCAASPCQVSVAFAPSSSASPGTLTGSLNLREPLTGSLRDHISHRHHCTQTTATVSPGFLTFPLRFVNSTSFPQTMTVTNTGTTNVTPGNSCTINVSFSPTAIGSRNANVQIIFNATTSPSTVTLSGTAQ